MYLSDRDIKEYLNSGKLIIKSLNPDKPFDPETQIQPASIDLRLYNKFYRPRKDIASIDIALDTSHVENYMTLEEYDEYEEIELAPGEWIFGQTLEWFELPDCIAGKIEAKSRIARLGITVHFSADFSNPGYRGCFPLQIRNNNPFSIKIYPYIPIVQLILVKLSSIPEKRYSTRKDTMHYEESLKPSAIFNDPYIKEIRNVKIPI